jgi:hypothetical protein
VIDDEGKDEDEVKVPKKSTTMRISQQRVTKKKVAQRKVGLKGLKELKD